MYSGEETMQAMPVVQPIGAEWCNEATQILLKYKSGKANLDNNLIENEEWYKLRHWEWMRKKKSNMVEPASAWALNCILSKHADAMDAYPAINVLPREEMDKDEAEMLKDILPLILEQNDFEEVYDETVMYKLKMGTGVYGIFWDPDKHGIGDISIEKVDLLNMYWTPGITNIQDSRYVFLIQLQDNDILEARYPELKGKLGQAMEVKHYVYDDTIDTTNQSCVVDCYYKKIVDGREILHYVKYVNNVVLYATENDTEPRVDIFGQAKPSASEAGLYDHGKYPFEFDVLYSYEGTPAGFGIIDIAKSPQEFIDRGKQAVLQNMLVNARPRHFVNKSGSVNEQEYADITKDFIHIEGSNPSDSIMPVNTNQLNPVYLNIINEEITQLKETTGNRDVANGGTTGGVTAASALSAMMENSGKMSRDSTKASYRSFRRIVLMVIELVRQFYDMPRWFRIIGKTGEMRFVQYSNARIKEQPLGDAFGVDQGNRLPLFDIKVSAEKSSPYSKLAQNELALQFYGQGFFNPQMADQALACLEMMDFDGKDEIMKRISQNAMMLQQIMMLGQMVEQFMGPEAGITEGIAQQYGMAPQGGDASMPQPEGTQESSITANARKRASEASTPR